MEYFSNYDYVPHWLLILLLFLSSGAVQYGLIGAVKLVRDRGRRRTTSAETAASSKPSLHVIHLEPAARISDEDLRERTEGLR